jgi:benzoylformate decarboxylase
LTVIIVNNGGYAALGEFLSHFNLKEPIGTEVRGIDFVGLARALGCEGIRVERPHELAPALTTALHSPQPTVVDVLVAAPS